MLPPVGKHLSVPREAAEPLLAGVIVMPATPVVVPVREWLRNTHLPVPDLLIAHQVFLI